MKIQNISLQPSWVSVVIRGLGVSALRQSRESDKAVLTRGAVTQNQKM